MAKYRLYRCVVNDGIVTDVKRTLHNNQPIDIGLCEDTVNAKWVEETLNKLGFCIKVEEIRVDKGVIVLAIWNPFTGRKIPWGFMLRMEWEVQ